MQHWDADVLNRKLREFGFGLLVLFNETMELLKPRERKVSPDKLRELQGALDGRPEIKALARSRWAFHRTERPAASISTERTGART